MTAATVNADFDAFCAARNLRRTTQRMVIFGIMNGNRHHPSVEEVWAEARRSLPSLSLDTVYRILQEFHDGGLFGCLPKYEKVRFDGNRAPHGHFICLECGEITDFELRDGVDLTAGLPDGVRAEHQDVRISGICRRCAGKYNQNNRECVK